MSHRTKMRKVLIRTASVLAIAGACGSGAAFAESGIDEIVVVSQKRAAAVNVQNVAGAVTAFDSNAIENAFADNLTDLGRLAPNVQLNQAGTFSGFANFFIRGIGISNTIRTVDPAVGVFVDGVYIGYGPTSVLDTLDVAAVEILRGPQGTLFGKNVTGGAVTVQTRRPEFEFGGNVAATLGAFDRIDVQGAINVPIVDDTLAARVAFMTRNSDGFFDNRELDTTKSDIDVTVIRPSLRWTPTDNLDISLIAELYRDQGDSSSSQNQDSRINPRLLGADRTPTPAIVQRIFGYTPPDDKYEIFHNLEGYVDAEAKSLILDANYDLGHGVATLVTGYREVRYDTSTDFDGSPFTVFHFPDNREDQNQFSAELRYASTFSDVVEFTVGLFYFTQEMEIGERREFFAGGTAEDPTIARSAGLAVTDDQSYAVFGEGSVAVTDSLSLIAGGRYTYEEKEITLCPFTPVIFDSLSFSDCPSVLNDSESWGSFSPKLGVNWQATDDILAYAFWTRGFRSGSFNARAGVAEALGPVDEEEVSTYELGLKTQLFENRLRFNLAGYLSDYENIQRTISDTVLINGLPQVLQIPRNAAAAQIWGFEAEGSALLFEGFRFDASVGYTNASYDEFSGIDANRDGIFDPETDDPLAAELEFERVPEWQYTVAASYETALGDLGFLNFRTSYQWVDSQFVDTLNSPSLQLDAYGLLDASISYTDPSQRYEVSVFGRNLNDAEFHDFGFDGGTHRAVWGGQPRTWGVRVSASF